MRIVKHISLLLLLLLAAGKSFAQFSNLEKAVDLYHAKNLDSAAVYIDAAAQHPQTNKDYNVWMVRGFIYKDLFKTRDSEKAVSANRDAAVESFRKSLQLDTANQNEQKEGVIKSLKYLAAMYHNDIPKTLDTLNYQTSLNNAHRYVEISKLLDPNFNDKAFHYEVYLTIGSMFEGAFEANTSKNNLDLAKVFLFKAYDIDSTTFSVNKNLALLYYNQAVEIIRKMDVDISLEELPLYQDRSVKLGKQALPYALRAHNLNPKDRTVLECVMGIYYLLNDMDQFNLYKKKFEESKE